jgi:hypothetical protein
MVTRSVRAYRSFVGEFFAYAQEVFPVTWQVQGAGKNSALGVKAVAMMRRPRRGWPAIGGSESILQPGRGQESDAGSG